MDQRTKLAEEFFRAGQNCAQAVLLAFSEKLKADNTFPAAAASGFGGGMARLQKTCGALTGAFMVIGIRVSAEIKDPDERNEKIRTLIRELHSRFLVKYGSSDCADLIGYDLNDPDDPTVSEREQIKEKICLTCVTGTVEMLNDILDWT